MDPHAQFCPNPCCPAKGRTAQGNIKVHSYPQRRYRCTTCRKTFAATTGTPFYRLHRDPCLASIRFPGQRQLFFPDASAGCYSVADGVGRPFLACSTR